MSLFTEVLGPEALKLSKTEVKSKIKYLFGADNKTKGILLHEWSKIKGVKLTGGDFIEVML